MTNNANGTFVSLCPVDEQATKSPICSKTEGTVSIQAVFQGNAPEGQMSVLTMLTPLQGKENLHDVWEAVESVHTVFSVLPAKASCNGDKAHISVDYSASKMPTTHATFFQGKEHEQLNMAWEPVDSFDTCLPPLAIPELG